MQVHWQPAAAQTLSLEPFRLCFWTSGAQPSRPLSPVWYSRTPPSHKHNITSRARCCETLPHPTFTSPQSSDFSMAKFSTISTVPSFLGPITAPYVESHLSLAPHDIPVLSFAESELPAMNGEVHVSPFPLPPTPFLVSDLTLYDLISGSHYLHFHPQYLCPCISLYYICAHTVHSSASFRLCMAISSDEFKIPVCK